jgi:MoxR-like ATPase
VKSTIALDELYAMQKEVVAVTIPDAINELMDEILCELREKGVHVSDRKYFGYYPLAQAMAWLDCRAFADASDLLILRHYLWTNPDERLVINHLLEHKCVNPLKDVLDNIIKMAVEAYSDFEVTSSGVDSTRRIGKLRNEFMALYESFTSLLEKAQNSSEINQINAALDQLEEYSRKAHTTVGFTYAPLAEIYSLSKTA